MPKVSVVVPVYNAHDYLERCINSITAQTLEDIEIVAVDDCSADNSLEILNNYAKNDSRIKVIHHETNGGESKARNTGIDNASGEYLAFVDNDDTIDPDFLEKLYNKASETGAEIVKAEAHIFEIDGSENFDGMNEKIRKYGSKLFFSSFWWTAIYKRELINRNHTRLLEDYPLGGDVLFLNELILKCNKLELVDKTYYNYYRRENSGDSKVLTFDKVKSVLTIHEKILDNTLNCKDVQNDIEGLKNICGWCFDAAIGYAYRNRTVDNLKFCIDKAVDFYDKTEKYLVNNNYLTKAYPVMLYHLEERDKAGLVDLYLKNGNPQKMFIANLRFIHSRQKCSAEK